MRMNPRLLLFVALAGAAAVLPLTGAEKKKSMKMMMPPPQVMLEKVSLRPNTSAKEYVGLVVGSSEVELQPRVSGFLQDVTYKEGEMVKKGQLLFKIEDTTYQAKVDSIKAQIQQCEAELEYAQSNYHRKDTLIKKEAAAKSTFEDATRLLKTAKASLAANRASLMDAENNLSYTKVYAPMDGLAGKATYSLGNYITPSGSPLASLVAVDPIRVKFSISERDFLNYIKDRRNPADFVKIGIRMANGEKYTDGEFKPIIIANRVDNETGTIMIWAQGKNPNLRLLPGGYATVVLTPKKVEEKPSVSLSSVMSDQNGTYVYVVGADNIARRRNVTAGAVSNDRQIIENGLKPGEVVISDGTHKVIPGMPVDGVLSSNVTIGSASGPKTSAGEKK